MLEQMNPDVVEAIAEAAALREQDNLLDMAVTVMREQRAEIERLQDQITEMGERE